MSSFWNDDERDINVNIAYSRECPSPPANLFKDVIVNLEEDKWNTYNECEFIDYAYENPVFNIMDDSDYDDNATTENDLTKESDVTDLCIIDPSSDPLQPSKFMYI